MTEPSQFPPVPRHGRIISLKSFAGAEGSRLIDGAHRQVEEHAHEWPVLSLFLMGGYRNVFDGGAAEISSPSVLLYRGGDAHANCVGGYGHEQIQIEFDPQWLGLRATDLGGRSFRWIGGNVAAQAKRLARLWTDPACDELAVAAATRSFLQRAVHAPPAPKPQWLVSALGELGGDDPPSTPALAKRFGLSPDWFAQAYRSAAGEGIADTKRRRRVERAARLLRGSPTASADIAVAAGFCDQSHMIRSFKAVLGRTPAELRRDFTGDAGS